MSLEPFRQRVGFAVGKKIDGPVSFQVHQNCPITMAAAPGPIIHAETSHLRHIHQKQLG